MRETSHLRMMDEQLPKSGGSSGKEGGSGLDFLLTSEEYTQSCALSHAYYGWDYPFRIFVRACARREHRA